jgi:hypothetical protein
MAPDRRLRPRTRLPNSISCQPARAVSRESRACHFAPAPATSSSNLLPQSERRSRRIGSACAACAGQGSTGNAARQSELPCRSPRRCSGAHRREHRRGSMCTDGLLLAERWNLRILSFRSLLQHYSPDPHYSCLTLQLPSMIVIGSLVTRDPDRRVAGDSEGTKVALSRVAEPPRLVA